MGNAMDFDGKTVVVTGGSRGLGLTVVQTLVARGAQVAVLARNADRLGESLRDLGDGAWAIATDISDPDQVRRAFGEIAVRWGKVNFLVNNAGLGSPYAVDQLTDQEISSELGVNIAGMVYCVRSAVPLMRAAGGGVIVNVSSESAQQPVLGLALYGATKAALEAFSMALNGELRADGIRTTVLRLGRMKDTGFNKGWGLEQRAQAVARWREAGRFSMEGEPMDTHLVADTLATLLLLPPAAQARLLDLREFAALV